VIIDVLSIFLLHFMTPSVIINGVVCKNDNKQKTILEDKKMAKCSYCNKGVSFGIRVSHSHRRSNRMWKPNVKRVAAIVDGSPKRVHVCTRCLRSGKVERAV